MYIFNVYDLKTLIYNILSINKHIFFISFTVFFNIHLTNVGVRCPEIYYSLNNIFLITLKSDLQAKVAEQYDLKFTSVCLPDQYADNIVDELQTFKSLQRPQREGSV